VSVLNRASDTPAGGWASRIPALAALGQRWQQMAPRERQMIGGGTLLVGFALLWFVGVAPAWKTLSRAPAEMNRAEAELQSMQKLAEEARELRSATAVPAEQAQTALRAATARLGDKARLSVQGDRAVLTLNGIGPAALRDWLAEARSGARARPVEASLTRAAQGLTGTVVVALGGGT
jgi:general secretion pathway protein M